MPKKITIVLGGLEGPLEERLKKTKETASQLTRRVLATEMGLPNPVVKIGNPLIAKLAARRWAKEKQGDSPGFGQEV